ncbi:porin family protein [Pontibacter mangrovi]|uniref:PorT family protein n=1 Tax=Pontibacter mangrovi TaxID=2589816 RepID=A0A501W5B7_9BACT|nr:porin family protein [Pontibacter mangrovi]TPE43855.1 PorT family protein [Pontibacter mangrovi]
MRKLFLTIICVLAVSAAASAQIFQAGVKAGVSSSNVKLSDLQNEPLRYANPENITGYHAGAFTRLQLLGLVLQPEAILSTTGGKVAVSDDNTSTSVRVEKFRFNRLDVPLLVGLSFLKVARVQAGPVASMLLSATEDGQSIKDYYNSSDWGYQAGVGVDIGALTLDLRYERIARDFTNPARESSGKVRNEQFLVSLGLKLIQ